MASPAHASFGFVKPDSKIYFIQPVLESIRLFFTFSNEAKAEYLLELADRRTDEMNIAPSNSIANRYNEHFAQLENIVDQTSGDAKEQLAEKVKVANLREQETLANIYTLVPEAALDAIVNAQENSSKHVENILQSGQNDEKAAAYRTETEQIRRVEQATRRERVERVPMEGSSKSNPSENAPRALNPLNQTQELRPLNPTNETEDRQGGGAIDEPVVPVPLQPFFAPE